MIHLLGILSALLTIITGVLFFMEKKPGKANLGKAKRVLLIIISIIGIPQGYLIFSAGVIPAVIYLPAIIVSLLWILILVALIKKDLMQPVVFRIILAITLIGFHVTHYFHDGIIMNL